MRRYPDKCARNGRGRRATAPPITNDTWYRRKFFDVPYRTFVAVASTANFGSVQLASLQAFRRSEVTVASVSFAVTPSARSKSASDAFVFHRTRGVYKTNKVQGARSECKTNAKKDNERVTFHLPGFCRYFLILYPDIPFLVLAEVSLYEFRLCSSLSDRLHLHLQPFFPFVFLFFFVCCFARKEVNAGEHPGP